MTEADINTAVSRMRLAAPLVRGAGNYKLAGWLLESASVLEARKKTKAVGPAPIKDPEGFIESQVVFCTERISLTDLYAHYTSWAIKHKRSPTSKALLNKSLLAAHPAVAKRKSNGKWFMVGLKLKGQLAVTK